MTTETTLTLAEAAFRIELARHNYRGLIREHERTKRGTPDPQPQPPTPPATLRDALNQLEQLEREAGVLFTREVRS